MNYFLLDPVADRRVLKVDFEQRRNLLNQFGKSLICDFTAHWQVNVLKSMQVSTQILQKRIINFQRTQLKFP